MTSKKPKFFITCCAIVIANVFLTLSTAEEKLPVSYLDQFDMPMNLDPEMPLPKEVEKNSVELVPLWKQAFAQENIDLKRETAEATIRGYRLGMKDVLEFEEPFIAEFKSTSNEILLQTLAKALIEFKSTAAIDAFAERTKKGTSLVLARIIEPEIAKANSKDLESFWLEKIEEDYLDQKRQAIAIQCLGISKNPKATERLSEMVGWRSAPFSQRLHAASALASIDSAKSLGLAKELIADSSIQTSMIAATLLKGNTDAKTELAKLCGHSNDAVVSRAAANLFDLDKTAVKPLVSELFRSSNPNVRMIAAKAAATESSLEDTRLLIDSLGDLHPPIRTFIGLDLTEKFKDEKFASEIQGVIEFGVKKLDKNRDWRKLEQILLLTGRLDQKQVAMDLLKFLGAKRFEVSVPSAWALRKLSVPETLEPTLKFLTQFNTKRLRVAGGGSGKETANAVRRYEFDDMQNYQLVQLLTDHLHKPAVEEFKRYIPKGREMLGERSRECAVRAFGKIFKDDPQPKLVSQLQGRYEDFFASPPETPSMRAACAYAMAGMNCKDKIKVIRKFRDLESTNISSGFASAWAANKLAGDEIKPPTDIVKYSQGWFIEPLGSK